MRYTLAPLTFLALLACSSADDGDANRAPRVVSTSHAADGTIDVSESVSVWIVAEDPDGDTLEFTWTLDGAVRADATANEQDSALVIVAEELAGPATLTCAVSDGAADTEIAWTVEPGAR